MSEPARRVLVVDDHPLFRRGVRQLLAMEPSLECVGEASGGEEALALARELVPDLILLDLKMAGMDGLEVLGALRDSGVGARIVLLTVSDQDEDVVAALRGGADGYLLKDMEPEELLAQLRDAAAGDLAVSQRLTRTLARVMARDEHSEQDPARALLARLTPRERRVLRALARGASNKEIARQLGVTEGTVKVHMRNLLRKTGLHSRVEAAVWAVQQGVG